MKRNTVYTALATLAGVVGVGYGAYAQTGAPGASAPSQIAYQGYLENQMGPIVDPQNLRFLITASPAHDIEDALWTEELTDVPFHSGYFSVTLGQAAAFPDGLFDGPERYLRVRIGGATLDGAQRLLATPYAITAQVAQNFTVEQLSAGSINAQGPILGTGGNEADPGATGGQIHLVRGSAEMAIDANEIKTNGAFYINQDAGDGTTIIGSATSGTTIRGPLRVDGPLNFTDFQVDLSTEYRVLQYNGGTGGGGVNDNGINMTSVLDSLCFITYSAAKSNGSDWAGCEIVQSAFAWRLQATSSGSSDAECKARCIQW